MNKLMWISTAIAMTLSSAAFASDSMRAAASGRLSQKECQLLGGSARAACAHYAAPSGAGDVDPAPVGRAIAGGIRAPGADQAGGTIASEAAPAVSAGSDASAAGAASAVGATSSAGAQADGRLNVSPTPAVSPAAPK